MKWTDTQDIAMALTDAHPDVDPQQVRFTDLHRWVMELEASTTIRTVRREDPRSDPGGMDRRRGLLITRLLFPVCRLASRQTKKGDSIAWNRLF